MKTDGRSRLLAGGGVQMQSLDGGWCHNSCISSNRFYVFHLFKVQFARGLETLCDCSMNIICLVMQNGLPNGCTVLK